MPHRRAHRVATDGGDGAVGVDDAEAEGRWPRRPEEEAPQLQGWRVGDGRVDQHRFEDRSGGQRGPAKDTIVTFIAKVCDAESQNAVPVADRLAVVDTADRYPEGGIT